MDTRDYDGDYWERLWSRTLREHPDKIALRPPNARLREEFANLSPGRALDAGCGHGAESLWLAARGWEVDAVDVSAAALRAGQSLAEAAGAEVAARLRWIEGDLGRWSPAAGAYDLVLCLYVHVAGDVAAFVQRMGAGVAMGGTLFLLGHRPVDPETGRETAAAGQRQVCVDAARAALPAGEWDLLVAEDRPRAQVGTGVDAVVLARRTR